MSAAKTPHTLLAYVPITDPTSPYHSLVYLASYARAHGFESIEIRDTNVEGLNYLASPDVMRDLLAGWNERYATLGRQPSLCGTEQVTYLHLLRARLLAPDSAQQAIAVLRDPECFYDYAAYHDAVRTITIWLQSLSLEGCTGQFGHGFNLNTAPANLCSIEQLTDPDILARIVGPFQRYYRERFLPWLAERRFDVVGLNVTYTSQLPYALWLAREVRRTLPDCYIVLGGTEIGDVWKYALQRDRLGELFAAADACIVGEGESAFVELLETLRAGRRPSSLPNGVVFGTDRSVTPPARITYENLDALPVPEYDLLSDRGYFAPEPFVYYSPTRGCYWNRCTFCDYGLNFGTPTSPWRQRNPDAVLADLRIISKHARFVYLSVDVLAPGAIVKLARAVSDAGIDIRWGAEVRLEKHFTAEACATLRQSGCVAVSVGFESGSQRVLDLIDKGTRPAQIATTIGDYHRNGIAVQMMGFTGFPSETEAEALASVAFLEEHRAHWTVAGLGEFVLTPGAIVAMRPADFGILEHGPHVGDDIARVLRFTESVPLENEQRETIARAKRKLNRQHFDRPFAGGIDTPHSLMYYDRFGTAFPVGVVGAFEAERSQPVKDALVLNGRIVEDVTFDPWSCADADAFEELRLRVGREEGRLLRGEEFASRLNVERPVLQRFPEPMTYFIRGDGMIFPLSAELYRLLAGIERGRTMAELLAVENARAHEPDELALRVAVTLLSTLNLALSPQGARSPAPAVAAC